MLKRLYVLTSNYAGNCCSGEDSISLFDSADFYGINLKNTVNLHFFSSFDCRMNSTIIGQRKPKENKRKKKKRTQERRYSEGEASDYENHVQPNHCKKVIAAEQADANKNKDTEHKNNLIFDIEI